MKKLLLILMTLAMAAHAQAMSDAKIKALLIGTWRADCGTRSTSTSTIELKADGSVDYGKDIGSDKWDIKDGMYREIPEAPERTYYYKILYLTKTAFLILGVTPHAKGYFFYWSKPVGVDQ